MDNNSLTSREYFWFNGAGLIVMSITVEGPWKRIMDFSTGITTGLAPLKINFVNISSNNSMSLKWNFEDQSNAPSLPQNISNTHPDFDSRKTKLVVIPNGKISNTASGSKASITFNSLHLSVANFE